MMIVGHRLASFLTIICLLLEAISVSPFSNVSVGPVKKFHQQRCFTPFTTTQQYQHQQPIQSTCLLTSSSHKSSLLSSSSTSTTSLSMGLRSFLRRGRGSNNNNNDKSDNQGEENPEDIKAALEAIKADLEAVTQKEKEEKLLKEKLDRSIKGGVGGSASTSSKQKNGVSSTATLGGAGASSSNSVPNNGEKPKSRVKMAIHEMKKIASPSPTTPSPSSSSSSSSRYGETVRDRVKRVKSGDMTEDEKLAFLNNALTPRTAPGKNKGPRIRQAIPDPTDGRMSSSRSKSASSSAGAGGAGGANSSYRSDPLWNRVLGNAKQKDKGMARSPYNIEDVVGSDSAKRQYLDMVTDPNRFSSYAAMGGYKSSQSPVEDTPNGSNSKTNSNSNNNNDDDDDSNKGGVIENLKSVLTNEKEEDDPDSLANRLQSAAIIKEKQDAEMKQKRDLERKAEKERIAEAQRQAAEEIRRREEEKIQQAKEAEERLMREEQEKMEAEENRKKAILAAQEEYWAKQLQKDKGKGMTNMMSDEDKERNLQQVTMTMAKQSAIDQIRAEQRDESEILQQAAEDDLHEREHNAEILETSVARTTNTVPQPVLDDVSSGAFVKEQERKKAELDKIMAEQKARLATLNSPLPKTPETPVVTNTPTVVPTTPFVPNTSVNTNVNPIPTPAPVQSTSRGPMPGLSLSELTMNANRKKQEVSRPPPPPVPEQNSTPSLSLKEMTMLNTSKPKSKPVNSPVPERKGPIRQNVPIKDLMDEEEDDDVDFFEYSRNGDNKNVSIKDIMSRNGGSTNGDAKSAAKQKSKMWGIDIDKFDL